MPEHWKNCGSCKKPIPFNTKYWVCSVSSCNRGRFQLAFCSLSCWDAHVPVMNHRSAWAEEKVSPAASTAAAVLPRVGGGVHRAAASRAATAAPTPAASSTTRRRVVRPSAPEAATEQEVLIVASRLKKYIKDRSGMSTSADVLSVLSEMVRRQCDSAISRARDSGRRTVKARDFRGD